MVLLCILDILRSLLNGQLVFHFLAGTNICQSIIRILAPSPSRLCLRQTFRSANFSYFALLPRASLHHYQKSGLMYLITNIVFLPLFFTGVCHILKNDLKLFVSAHFSNARDIGFRFNGRAQKWRHCSQWPMWAQENGSWPGEQSLSWGQSRAMGKLCLRCLFEVGVLFPLPLQSRCTGRGKTSPERNFCPWFLEPRVFGCCGLSLALPMVFILLLGFG